MGSLSEFGGGKLTSQEAIKKENYLIKQEAFTLTNDTNKAYNVVDLLTPAQVANFDLATIQVELFVVDAEVDSPTNGYYIDAVNAAHVGFKTTGEVLVRNVYGSTLDFLIRIRVSKKADK